MSVVALVLLLAACGGDDDPAADDGTTPADDGAADDDAADDGATAADEGTADDEVAADHTFQDGDTIVLILPTAPGGGFEAQTVTLQPFFEEAMAEVAGVDITLRIEAMPGAGHLTGLQFVQNAEPDGLTLVYEQIDIGVAHQVIRGEDLAFTDFVPLGALGVNPLGLAVPTSLELPSDDFMGLAERSESEPVLIAESGVLPQLQLISGILSQEDVTFEFDPVTVDGSAGLSAALLRQEVEVGIIPIPGATPLIEDNPDDLEILVNLACERSVAAPDVETIVEQGVPGADRICSAAGEAWRMVLGPPGLSEVNAAVLQEAMQVATSNSDFQDALFETGFEPTQMSPDDMVSYVQDLAATWEELSDFIELEDTDS